MTWRDTDISSTWSTYSNTTSTDIEDIITRAIKKMYDEGKKERREEKGEKKMKSKMPKIKNIDFQPPLTVVIWEDGTKTFVKCLDTDEFDPEKGAAMAIAKKALGDTYHYNDVINYYIEKYYKKHPNTTRSFSLSIPEQDIIWLTRQCGEEVEKFIVDTLMEIYAGM